MRIDAHQHFWRYNPTRDAWITDEMAVLKKDFLPAQLVTELAENNIQGCIAVQADQSEAETHFLLDLAERHDIIHGVVGWVNLCGDDVAQRLQTFSTYSKLCGFRHIVQAEADDRFMLQPAFLHGLKCLEKFGFTYDILVYARQLPAALELVSRFSSQLFVIDHIAKPSIKRNLRLPWASDLCAIAKNPNVYCKISGLVTEADWHRWTPDDFKPYLDTVFEAFGVDRLIFGSDWPVCLLAADYHQVVALVTDYMRGLPKTDVDKIFGLNASRFYKQRASHHAVTT